MLRMTLKGKNLKGRGYTKAVMLPVADGQRGLLYLVFVAQETPV